MKSERKIRGSIKKTAEKTLLFFYFAIEKSDLVG